MSRDSLKVLTAEVVEAVSLTELCRSCNVQSAWVVELVEEGILEPVGSAPENWRFSSISITRTRIARSLQHELGINSPGIALALDLLQEREQMRLHLQRLEQALTSSD